MRLNIYLQQSGAGSRREAERLIAAGRVTINGKTALLTQPVQDGDVVALDGRSLRRGDAIPRLFRLHKPVDVLVTNRDSQGRATIFDLPALKRRGLPRLMAVGRLDVNSEGLLLLSTDGPLAQKMMSPKTALPRVYRVRAYGRLSPDQISVLKAGITISGVYYRGAEVEEEDGRGEGRNGWYRIVLTEGKNREIRKLMEYFGCSVNRLIRQAYGPFELGRLAKGMLEEVPEVQVQRFLTLLQ